MGCPCVAFKSDNGSIFRLLLLDLLDRFQRQKVSHGQSSTGFDGVKLLYNQSSTGFDGVKLLSKS
jgi:hypothetical protein